MDNLKRRSTLIKWHPVVCGGVIVLVVLVAGLAVYNLQRKNEALTQNTISLNTQIVALSQNYIDELSKDRFTSLQGMNIAVFSPLSGDHVTSPLGVLGRVPAGWAFEASFPVKLLNSKSEVVARTTATVLGDWTSGSPVYFSAKLTWSSAQTGAGSVVLTKDNPSGLASNDDSLTIPVQFN